LVGRTVKAQTESSDLIIRLKLTKTSSRTRLRQNFFSNKVVNLWNNLPGDDVVMVNCFNRHCADNRSYSMEC